MISKAIERGKESDGNKHTMVLKRKAMGKHGKQGGEEEQRKNQSLEINMYLKDPLPSVRRSSK